MNRIVSRIRAPVKRQRAEQYLLITLLSFAASVVLTRLFLELTGYPQIGGGGLHIAHVLWGGLLLFVAALVPLILANRWAYTTSAVMAGVGVGLFIDEVGKFITQTNDYFYPAAAPIIYAFFLLTVLVYLQIRRPPSNDMRAELYQALESLEEVLDNDLDSREHIELEVRLRTIADQDRYPDLAHLADHLLTFLQSKDLTIVPTNRTRLNHWQANITKYVDRLVNLPRLNLVILVGLAGLGVIAFARLGIVLINGLDPNNLSQMINQLAKQTDVKNYPVSVAWFGVRVVMEGIAGLLLLFGSALMLVGRQRNGIRIGYFGLLLSLSVVNLLVFYFDQFSTIILAALQFIVLLLVIVFRRKMI